MTVARPPWQSWWITVRLAALVVLVIVGVPRHARGDDPRATLGSALRRERTLIERAVALHLGLSSLEQDQRTLAWTETMLEHRTRESMRRLDAYRDGSAVRDEVARRRMRSLARLSRGGLVALALAPVAGEGEEGARARLTRARTLRLVIRRDVDELDVFRRALRRVEAEAATVRREAAALATLAMMHGIERQALMALERGLEPSLARAERERRRNLRGVELRRGERDILASIVAGRSLLDRNGGTLLDRAALTRPVRGEIVGRFGSSKDPVLGVEFDRAGVEFAARPGEHVVAPAEGDVVLVSELPGFDRVVVLEHGDGIRTMLARLADVHVHPGQRVARGERIARVAAKTLDDGLGTTLYLELRHAERAVDPTKVFATEGSRRTTTRTGVGSMSRAHTPSANASVAKTHSEGDGSEDASEDLGSAGLVLESVTLEEGRPDVPSSPSR